MEKIKDDHRGHAIVPRVSMANSNIESFGSSYTILRIEPNNNYRGILDGVLSQSFCTEEEALAAAMKKAKEQLDAVLDGV